MKRTSRALALALTLSLCLNVFSSCAGGKDAVRYKDFGLIDAIFRYQCCLDKTSYLYEANGTTSDRTSASQLQDNAAIWAMEDAKGVSVAETLKQGVLNRLEWMLYLEQYAKDRGYTLTDEDRAEVKNDFNELVKNFETKSAFNKAMKNYGINYDQMYEYYLHQALASIGNYLLFGEGGAMEISESAAKAYYEKNYITVGVIYINNQNKTYPNGKTVYLPDGEKAEKTALAENLYQRLQNGEDFAALYREYSDRQDANGDTYTFTHGEFGVDAVEEKAFALSVGTFAKVETDAGVFLLARRGLNNAYFEQEKKTVTTALEEAKKAELLEAAAADFILDEAFIDSLSVAELNFVK